ncbi:class I SAM-dependent methyltransferase [Thermosipho ferrireducens]|uniref:Class I SAM-dependent methyltransferase n=1 Tax=Thermosipho ferrireducens TaxID=2571116 RepID=A0ABX7S5Q8_9BACT|nr:class I SAM-dependent methyltransferase [Thermosipho ferrireducens]QTA37894.1 class I SAM-dependent methyltransferase [Thermosipho ferrireducens]
MKEKYVVTTSYRPTKECVRIAHKLANKFDAKYINRRHVNEKLEKGLIDFYYVVEKDLTLAIKWKNGEFFFHQGISKIRMENIKNGHKDYLIESINPSPDDVIYDATFGLGSEAILLSAFVPDGKVIGTEGSIHIYRVVKWGLKYYKTNVEWIKDALKRIELHYGNYKTFIKNVPDKHFDIVYCDPMFENPIYESSSLNPLRTFAVYDPLNFEDIEEMIRIAKKRVVIKTLTRDALFDKIKSLFNRTYLSKKSGVIYGVIEL